MGSGSSKRLGMIDLDTGEIFEHGVPVWVKAKIKWHEGFFMSFQDALLKIAEDKEMNLEMHRVWSVFLSRLGFENWVCIPQKEIIETLSMKQSNVSRAIKRLVQKGLILEGPRIGGTKSYRINSRYAWKGSIRNLEANRMGQVSDLFEEAQKRQLCKE